MGATGNTSALDSRIKMKLKIYSKIKTSHPKTKNIDIYKEVIKLSKGFENRVEETIDSSIHFHKMGTSDRQTGVQFRDVVYVMMEEEFRPSNIGLASEVFAKIHQRVFHLIPDDL